MVIAAGHRCRIAGQCTVPIAHCNIGCARIRQCVFAIGQFGTCLLCSVAANTACWTVHTFVTHLREPFGARRNSTCCARCRIRVVCCVIVTCLCAVAVGDKACHSSCIAIRAGCAGFGLGCAVWFALGAFSIVRTVITITNNDTIHLVPFNVIIITAGTFGHSWRFARRIISGVITRATGIEAYTIPLAMICCIWLTIFVALFWCFGGVNTGFPTRWTQRTRGFVRTTVIVIVRHAAINICAVGQPIPLITLVDGYVIAFVAIHCAAVFANRVIACLCTTALGCAIRNAFFIAILNLDRIRF